MVIVFFVEELEKEERSKVFNQNKHMKDKDAIEVPQRRLIPAFKSKSVVRCTLNFKSLAENEKRQHKIWVKISTLHH